MVVVAPVLDVSRTVMNPIRTSVPSRDPKDISQSNAWLWNDYSAWLEMKLMRWMKNEQIL
jgi:hypothetical protein